MENKVKKNFKVLGMSCASCAVNTESMVKSLNGVVSANVSFANNSLQVEYNPQLVTPSKMKQALQSIGYDIIINESSGNAESGKQQQKAYKQLKRDTILSAIFTLPMLAGMFFMNVSWIHYVMMALATPVVFYMGRRFFVNAFKQARHCKVNMDTLVALSVGIAYVYSAFVTLFPHLLMVNGHHPGVYFESSAFVITFILLGKLLEEGAKSKTTSALKNLIGLQAKTVTVLQFGFEEKEIPIAEVKTGDVVMVKPGGKIPVDGTVLEGHSFVDESTISGEPVPVEKTKGDKVLSGTINQKGSFRFRAEKVGSETMLSQIIQMVEEAQGSKPPVQKLVDKIAAIFVPVVIGLAVLSFAVWLLVGGAAVFSQALLSLITVMVIACPCALGLATPTAIMVGVGKGAKAGILIRDAESLEDAHKADTIVLDKTGTITEGHPTVNELVWDEDSDTPQNRRLLCSIEKQSEHPLAESVVEYMKDAQLEDVQVQLKSLSGRGVQAQSSGFAYYVGNKRLMDEKGIAISSRLQRKAQSLLEAANTVFYFADQHKALAIVAVTDKIKDSSVEAIQSLQQQGLEVYMLTGDNESTAKVIAQQAGIRHYRAEMLPADKLNFIKQLQHRGKRVAMVGDGINDTEALAQADVSMAMGHGADVAMDVAKMTIISGDLTKISRAFKLSRITVRVIRQNLFWAFIYNLIGIPIAAGVLYPLFGFMLSPAIAGAAMAMSSVSVVTNSLRLRYKKI